MMIVRRAHPVQVEHIAMVRATAVPNGAASVATSGTVDLATGQTARRVVHRAAALRVVTASLGIALRGIRPPATELGVSGHSVIGLGVTGLAVGAHSASVILVTVLPEMAPRANAHLMIVHLAAVHPVAAHRVAGPLAASHSVTSRADLPVGASLLADVPKAGAVRVVVRVVVRVDAHQEVQEGVRVVALAARAVAGIANRCASSAAD
jgi:hypothetical protein